MSKITQIKAWCTLTIDGKQYYEDKVLSAVFEDKAGFKSDRLTVTLMPNVPRPSAGSKIKLELYNDLGEYMNCGLFNVQSTTRSQNKLLSVSATGVEFNTTQKTKRSQHYQDTTLSSVVSIVAGRLGHKVKFDTQDLEILSLYQTDETDINFLDRLARDYDTLFSIKNNIVFFVNKENDSLPIFSIDASKCLDISIKNSTKKLYKSGKVEYYDKKLASWISQDFGEGEPKLHIKCDAKTEPEALAKGKAKLAQSQRGTISGSLKAIGQKLYAGTKLQLINTYNNEDDGEYSIEAATHNYTRGGGWSVNVEFENFKLKGK